MGMISLTCPHCNKKNMTFDIAQSVSLQSTTGLLLGSLVALCRSCQLGVAIVAAPNIAHFRHGGLTFEKFSGLQSDLTRAIEIREVWPKLPEVVVPLHLPANVERIFCEAEKSRNSGALESAGIMYRKALDVASKLLDPTINDGNLASRLRKLAATGKLTTDIAEWATAIREAGNEATHEEEPPKEQEIDDLANLTRMVLVYLFEMPGRVRLMREHKEGAGATDG